MPDEAFEHPRLVAIYDALDRPWRAGGAGGPGAKRLRRDDLDVYLAIVAGLGARSVLDVGCGTGVFALLMADRGIDVTGVDPAAGSLAVARAKSGSDRVRWLHGDATTLPPLRVDLATMTGNAAQAVVDPGDWDGLLSGVHDALRPGGHFVFETRVPEYQAWQDWNRAASYAVTEVPGVGAVEHWNEVLDVSGPLVTFRGTCVFASDGEVLTSYSTLRFRERDEVAESLAAHGFTVTDVRDAPDRPGREFVFFAQRPE